MTRCDGVRRPSDYHKVLLKRLRAVEARLHEQFGEFESRAYVDTGPVVERALAVAAGIGWTGKNTCLIHPQLGSFGFLAVLLDVARSQSRRSKAAEAAGPGSLRDLHALHGGLPDRRADCALPDGCDACISYLTIEHKGPIAEELMRGHGPAGLRLRHLPGCVPVEFATLRTPIAADAELEPRAELIIRRWIGWPLWTSSPSSASSTARRCAGRDSWDSGAMWRLPWATAGCLVYAGLETWAAAADEGLRAAARWALNKAARMTRLMNRSPLTGCARSIELGRKAIYP